MNLKETDLREVYRNWKKNSNIFEAFIRSGPFVSLKTYDDFILNTDIDMDHLNNKHSSIIQRILHCKNDEFIIFDFEFNAAVEIAFLLNNLYNIKPIISFNMMFHPYGLIGSKDNIENLIKYGLNLNEINSDKYVLIFNYGRYMDFEATEYKKKLNNQYEVCEDDLPYADTLINFGYNKVCLFTEKEIKKDIKGYLDYIKNSNIQIDIKLIQGEI